MAIRIAPAFAVHPGEWLRAEIVEPHGLNVTDAARHLGVTRQAMSNLLNARAGLSADMAARLETEVTGRSSLTAISILEQRCFLGERLLRDSDAASMAASLELRVPLVDHVLTGAVNRLDDRLRYNPVGRKQALRNAGLDGLDPALFERPKQGFQLPFDDWIRQHLGGAMEETMRDSAATSAAGLDPTTVARVWDAFRDGGPGIFWSRVWALYVLIRWCDANGVAL